jgi:hypothetical protein
MGEIIEDLTPKKKTSRAVMFAAIASMTGAVVAFATSSRHEPRRAPAPVAALPSRPATVRVNFNSDPDGAQVSTSDGKSLGLTPLSIEVPYSDSAVEYVFKKQGFETKSMYIVPNLPSPVFASLQEIEPEKPSAPTPARKAAAAAPASTSSSARHSKSTPATPTPSSGRKPADDDVLEPGFR